MAIDEKLLARAKSTPAGLRFEEAVTLAEQLGWIRRTVVHGGSHQYIFHHPLARRIKDHFPRPLNLQNENGMAKAYQVRQLIAMAHALQLIQE